MARRPVFGTHVQGATLRFCHALCRGKQAQLPAPRPCMAGGPLHKEGRTSTQKVKSASNAAEGKEHPCGAFGMGDKAGVGRRLCLLLLLHLELDGMWAADAAKLSHAPNAWVVARCYQEVFSPTCEEQGQQTCELTRCSTGGATPICFNMQHERHKPW